MDETKHTAVFGAGCFWCVEAVFSELKGVESVLPGYTGGIIKNPTYKQVCTGETGHAEVCEIIFNPDEITFLELLEVFFQTHDPTTLNQQGNDKGTQYRSAIFCTNDEQIRLATEMKTRLNEEKIWKDTIVTEIVTLGAYYPAENYHNDYFANNPDQPYCTYVIKPKVEKFKKTFKDYLKE